MAKPKIGIFAIQGDFEKHYEVFDGLGAEVFYVKLPEEFEGIDGLVLPGGESPTMSRLINTYGLREAFEGLKKRDVPVFGTCAGAILLAKNVIDAPENFSLGMMDITIARNAYGRQRESFESEIEINWNGKQKKITGVFIRAPKILELGDGVEVIGKLENGDPVLVRQGNLLASTFHPELTDDFTVPEIFMEIVEAFKEKG